jgi:DNA-3-methyladenine glycosylase II
LVHIILEQQVSLASARAAFQKLQEAAGTLTPGKFLKFEPEELKRIGFSRQKAAYCRELAQVILNHELDLDNLSQLDDYSARSVLLKVKGIGPWTADIYLLMVLLRPDSWPSGDLALAVAVQELKNFHSRPAPEELERISHPWQPWRAVAARLLWFSYLRKRGLL